MEDTGVAYLLGFFIATASLSSAWQAARDFTATRSPVLESLQTVVELLSNTRCGIEASRENAK